MLPVLAALSTLLAPQGAPADALQCTARVLRPVGDDLGDKWKPGQTLPVDIARGDALCATGGGCTPRRTGGAPALRLENCKVGPSIGGDDRRLIGDPRLSGAGFARRLALRARVEARLSALGLSNAEAGGLADTYVQAPASADAALVRRALNGSAPALAALRRDRP